MLAGGAHRHVLICGARQAVQRARTFTASGGTVGVWENSALVAELGVGDASVVAMLPFGEHLLVLDSRNVLTAFSSADGAVFSRLEDLDRRHFAATVLSHPATYVNKVLLGSRQGRLQLWNVATQQMVYEFVGWGSAVTCVEQSTAVDVVAIGLADGRIMLHNLKTDRTLLRFVQEGGPVTALTFRTDGTEVLASAGSQGHIALWDLAAGRLHTMMREAHAGAVAGAVFLGSQPVLLTTGGDNAARMWIFDGTDGAARLLRARGGHGAPVTRVRWYGADGTTMITAGQDCALRSFNIMSDARTHELSQGGKKRTGGGGGPGRLRPLRAITAMACEPLREHDWDNLVTCHHRSTDVRSWNVSAARLGQHTLAAPTKEAAVSVALSACGNFAVVGYLSGSVVRFNVQSGKGRGEYSGGGGRPAHVGAVCGVAVDALNRQTLSAGRDGVVRSWAFKPGGGAAGEATLGSPALGLELHRESNLAAVLCEDFTVRVVDAETQRVVRSFVGHEGRLTDCTWSPDARWLVTASMDGTLRTWDVPTGRTLSRIAVPQPAVSVAFSPASDFLATAHVGERGVFLWANRCMFERAMPRALTDEELAAEPSELPLPAAAGAVGPEADADRALLAAAPPAPAPTTTDGEAQPPAPISAGLLTLSALPRTKWEGLAQLAQMRERNRPAEPPKAPKLAPFFLPTVAGLKPEFDVPEPVADGDKPRSRIMNFGTAAARPKFQRLLLEAEAAGNWAAFSAYVRGLSLGELDIEIRQLAGDLEGDVEVLGAFLRFALARLRAREDFELVQSYLQLFVTVHGPTLAAAADLAPAMSELLDEQRDAWCHLDGLLQHSLCILNFLRGPQL